jgi:hypothetical protein
MEESTMERFIAYAIACSLSFLEFGYGVFIATVRWGSIVAGSVLALFGLMVFGTSIICAMRETVPHGARASLGELYTPATGFGRMQHESHEQRSRRAA